MGRLVGRDLLKVVVEGRVVAGCREVGLGEVPEDLTVEVVLQMLERQRVIKDLQCYGSALLIETRKDHSRRHR